MRYLDGRAKEPTPYKTGPKGEILKPDDSVASEKEIEELEEKIDEFFQKDSLTKQHIFSMISDRLLLQVQKLDCASKIWEEI